MGAWENCNPLQWVLLETLWRWKMHVSSEKKKIPAPRGALELWTTRKRLTNAAARERGELPVSRPLSLSNGSSPKNDLFFNKCSTTCDSMERIVLCQLEGPKGYDVFMVWKQTSPETNAFNKKKKNWYFVLWHFLCNVVSHSHAYEVHHYVSLLLY